MESTQGDIKVVVGIDVLQEQNNHLKKQNELLEKMISLLNDISVKSDKSLIALKKVIDKTEGML